MALIKCTECGKEISDTTETCIHCGCPLSKVIFLASNDFIGIVGKYIIYDEKENVLAKIKRGEKYEIAIDKDTKFFVKCNTAFGDKVKIIAKANKTSKYMVGNNLGTSVLEIE